MSEVRNEIYNEHGDTTYYTQCKMKFFYADATSAESAVQSQNVNIWVPKVYANPNPEKLVNKVEVLLRQSHGQYSSTEAFEKNTVVYGNNPSHYLTLDLPQYKEQNATHFRVKVETNRQGDDDVWFELLDGDDNKTYANADFDKLLPVTSPINQPRKLRIYLKPKSTNPTIGGTALKAVYWGTSNPKSLWTGTQRVMRDNHYAEGLEPLGSRNFSNPKNHYSTVGFRLVQRP